MRGKVILYRALKIRHRAKIPITTGIDDVLEKKEMLVRASIDKKRSSTRDIKHINAEYVNAIYYIRLID